MSNPQFSKPRRLKGSSPSAAYKAAHPEKREVYNERARVKNRRAYHRMREYGMVEAAFDAMLAQQEGLCVICQRPLVNPVVDHDHRTGRVRALLCQACNSGIGLLGDDVNRLVRAMIFVAAFDNPEGVRELLRRVA